MGSVYSTPKLKRTERRACWIRFACAVRENTSVDSNLEQLQEMQSRLEFGLMVISGRADGLDCAILVPNCRCLKI